MTIAPQHAAMLWTMLQRTPTGVWVLLLALIALGMAQMRHRSMPPWRALLLPGVMWVLAVLGLVASFAASGWLVQALVLWLACAATVLALAAPRALAKGDRFDNASGRLHVAGSKVPLAVILGIFSLKYAVAASLAMHPVLVGNPAFVLGVAAGYGALNGLLTARGYGLWRLARRRQ